MTDNDIQNTPFVKQLAANDRPTRDAAVASLKSYLSAKRTFTRLDFLKLWKGLFYCMWMSDRPRTQQNLANELASLVDGLDEENYLLFMDIFWTTMGREWNNIDVLRMDKFLLLVRRYLEASFRYLQVRNWNVKMTTEYAKVLTEVPLNPTNPKIPNGLRYHLIDIYLDELEKFYPSPDDTQAKKSLPPIQLLLKPFEILVVQSPTKVVRTRAKDLLADERLQNWGYEVKEAEADKKTVVNSTTKAQDEEMMDEHSEEEDEEEEWGGIDD